MNEKENQPLIEKLLAFAAKNWKLPSKEDGQQRKVEGICKLEDAK